MWNTQDPDLHYIDLALLLSTCLDSVSCKSHICTYSGTSCGARPVLYSWPRCNQKNTISYTIKFLGILYKSTLTIQAGTFL